MPLNLKERDNAFRLENLNQIEVSASEVCTKEIVVYHPKGYVRCIVGILYAFAALRVQRM